jgi:hypothetical protein
VRALTDELFEIADGLATTNLLRSRQLRALVHKVTRMENAINSATPERVKYALELTDRIEAMIGDDAHIFKDSMFGWVVAKFEGKSWWNGDTPLEALRKAQGEK